MDEESIGGKYERVVKTGRQSNFASSLNEFFKNEEAGER